MDNSGDLKATASVSGLIVAGKDGYPAHLRQIGGYRVIRSLGRGAMAEVYLCWESAIEREVAVKVMRRGLYEKKESRQRFLSETRTMANLDGTGVVPIYQNGILSDWPWFSMKYIEGKDLDKYLALDSPTLYQRVSIVQRIATIVAAVHERGVTHRDLKPSNVMIDTAGRPHLMDFGIAKWLEGERRLDVTRDGVVPGTTMYMSLKRLTLQAQEDDLESDMYSLAVLAYEAIAGVHPHGTGHTSPQDLAQRIMSTPVAPLHELISQVPKAISDIVASALTIDEVDRPTAAQFADVFARALQDMSPTDSPTIHPAQPSASSTTSVAPTAAPVVDVVTPSPEPPPSEPAPVASSDAPAPQPAEAPQPARGRAGVYAVAAVLIVCAVVAVGLSVMVATGMNRGGPSGDPEHAGDTVHTPLTPATPARSDSPAATAAVPTPAVDTPGDDPPSTAETPATDPVADDAPWEPVIIVGQAPPGGRSQQTTTMNTLARGSEMRDRGAIITSIPPGASLQLTYRGRSMITARGGYDPVQVYYGQANQPHAIIITFTDGSREPVTLEWIPRAGQLDGIGM